MTYFDSHAHLTTGAFNNEQLEALLERAKQAGIVSIANICTDLASLEKGLALSEKYSWIHSTASTTPHDVEKEGEAAFDKIAFYARQGKLVAIGETGLDYFYAHSSPEIQQEFLIKYLHLALECSLPVVIHCREAFKDFFSILDAEYKLKGRHAPGILHCFTGNLEEAKQVIERGWYLSLSGIVTFKKSEELKEVAKIVPLDQLLIETDTPYLAPQSRRGKPNEPSFLPEIAEAIALLKGIEIEEVAKATYENARQVFLVKSFTQ